MFVTAQTFQKRASENNRISVFILFCLAIFLAVPSVFLIGDKVPSLESITNIQKALEAYRYSGPKDSAEYKDLISDLRTANKSQQDIETSLSSPYYRIFSTIFVRISVVGVAIYLVIMMNNSFKYNNAMAAMYRSRLSALLRGDEDISEFVQYSKLMDPVEINYDTRIKHPLEQVATAMREIAVSISKFAQTPKQRTQSSASPRPSRTKKNDKSDQT